MNILKCHVIAKLQSVTLNLASLFTCMQHHGYQSSHGIL